MQQKYCDHGRSCMLLTMTWPILLGAQFLRLGRKAEEGIDLALHEQVDRFDVTRDPVDVLEGIEADIGRHCGHEDMRVRSEILSNADRLALQIENAVDAFVREQLVAADMHAGEHLDRGAPDRSEWRRAVAKSMTKSMSPRASIAIDAKAGLLVDILEVRKALGADQLFGDELRRDADPGRS